MPKLRGLSISILCEDKTLDEYATEIENDNVITCWIPSEAGKCFTIHWRVDQDSPLRLSSKGFHCSMDGHVLQRLLFPSNTPKGTIDGVRTGPSSLRPFQFSNMNLTDDEALELLNSVVLDQIGCISIGVHRTKTEKMIVHSDMKYQGADHQPGIVHEKSKKAGSHCISLGATQAVPERRQVDVKYLDSLPLLTFNFRYRSKDILRAMGIMPPCPSQTGQNTPDAPNTDKGKKRRSESAPLVIPTESKRRRITPDTPTTVVKREPEEDDEIVFLQEQMGSLRQQMESLSRRINLIQAAKRRSSSTRTKREVSPTRPQSLPQNVIDLT